MRLFLFSAPGYGGDGPFQANDKVLATGHYRVVDSKGRPVQYCDEVEQAVDIAKCLNERFGHGEGTHQ